MRVLAIDHGISRMGFAISDDEARFARALPIQKVINSDVATALKLVGEENPELILVGIPLGVDSKPTQQSKTVENFIKKLAEKTQIEIKTWSEVGSSVFAYSNLKGRTKKNLDSESARIILQEFLDFYHTKI